MECIGDNHIFIFWGLDPVTNGVPKGWKCQCEATEYKGDNQ